MKHIQKFNENHYGEIAKIVRKEMLETHANAAIANALEDVFLLGDVQIGEG